MLFIVVGGPAGTGKTTLALQLAASLKCPFIEGDTLHPQANIDKMLRGIPLTDDDRWGWLKSVGEHTVDAGAQTAIVSCSMLKKSYRQYIETVATERAGGAIEFRFVFLHTLLAELFERVGNRQGHYMKSDMVVSQYEIMEVPEGAELVCNGGNCLAVDTTGRSLAQVFDVVAPQLNTR